ncbi:MAG: oligosaccharide flippase family protein, partial [Actinobacteria bacterium]|nr:oligosaccharide flippase family protein [Actinomycetota bacterium]
GVPISALVVVITQAVSLVQTIVIARLLTVAEVGIFVSGTVLTFFLAAFSQSGLSHALIQRDRDLEDAENTVFWATALGGVLMSLLALAAAPLIAGIFDSRAAGTIAAVTSGLVLLHSLTNVPDALIQRRFNFHHHLVVGPSIAITFAVVSITLCANGFGVWGLVIASYVSYVAWLVSTWSLARWRPGSGRASWRLWREMAGFGAPLLTAGMAERFFDMIAAVAAGRALDETGVGHYRYGRRIAMLPGMAVIQVCSYTLFPAFSRIAGDPARLKRAFLRALGWIWFVAAPVTALTVAIGAPLVVVLLGEPWRGAGVAAVAMAGFGLGEAMNSVSGESMKGAGRSQLLNWMTLTGLVVGIGLLFLLLPFGLVGIGLAISSAALSAGVLGLFLAAPVVGVSGSEIAGRMLPPVIASLAAMAVIMPLEHLVLHSDQRGVAAGLGLLSLDGLAFVLIYLATMRIIAPSTIAVVTGAARKLLDRYRQTSPGE